MKAIAGHIGHHINLLKNIGIILVSWWCTHNINVDKYACMYIQCIWVNTR